MACADRPDPLEAPFDALVVSGQFQIDVVLEVEPGARGGAEEPAQTQRGVGGDPRLATSDPVDTDSTDFWPDATEDEAHRNPRRIPTTIRALHASGQRIQAPDELDAFTDSLQAEVGAEPEHATVEIGSRV